MLCVAASHATAQRHSTRLVDMSWVSRSSQLGVLRRNGLSRYEERVLAAMSVLIAALRSSASSSRPPIPSFR